MKLSRTCLNNFSTNSRSIEKISVCSIAVRSIEVLWLSTVSRQHFNRFICQELVLDKFSIALDPSCFIFLYIVSTRFFSHFSLISLDRNTLFSLPNTPHSTSSPCPLDFWPKPCVLHLVWSFFSLFIMHFIHLDLGFWGFWNFLGSYKIDEVFVKFLGWVMFKLSYFLMHCITFVFSPCFMHLDVCFICWNLVCW